MKNVTATTSPASVSSAGPRRFIHIQNLGPSDVYVKYDGDAATLTATNGIKITVGETWQLNNSQGSFLFDQDVQVMTASGTADLRIQGAQ